MNSPTDLKKNTYRWEIASREVAKTADQLVNILLKIRGMQTAQDKHEFLTPTHPDDIPLSDVDIEKKAVIKLIRRVRTALENGEDVIVYGDYDADGVSSTAILWETLHALGVKVKPYLPDRFSEGYGLNSESLKKLKQENQDLKLILTVDNGIVAEDAVEIANTLGIDVIITDHHEKGETLPHAYAIVHTTKLCGAGISWIVSRELKKAFNKSTSEIKGLDMAAVGTIADQVPLIGVNRSLALFGLKELNKSTRPGIKCLMDETGIKGSVGVYDVGFVIAPRINAMGRMEHALDSLRFLCTRDTGRAAKLSHLLHQTNTERQKVVEQVVIKAKECAGKKEWKGVIVLSDKTYHEGIIGLAASRIVEEYYRPVIMISEGEKVSKASARSIPGFNIIAAIRKLDNFLLGGGGHPMAAGFSIETDKIDRFVEELEQLSSPLLTEELLKKRLRVDTFLDFKLITDALISTLKNFEPTGIGNPTPTFTTNSVHVLDVHCIGKDKNHLKLVVEKDGLTFDAVGFNLGRFYRELRPDSVVNIVYSVDENVWNGRRSIQLKLKDIVFPN